MSTLELTGLKGHHPLGLLAACGVLRRCGGTEGNRKVRLAWKQADDGSGWVAVLHRLGDLELGSLIRLLIRQASRQKDARGLTWSKSNRIDNRGEFRDVGLSLLQGKASRLDREALALLSALGSDSVVNTKTRKLEPTSLDFTSASQPFLKSIRDLAEKLSTKAKPKGEQSSPAESLRETLFGPWQYRDNEHSLGWDPQTQRLHALRHRLPEKDKQNRSVRGAVFLASQALPLFPCFAVGGKLRTTGFHRADGDNWFAWPIWRDPISLDTLRSLLGHPLDGDLERLGVEVVYRCRVVHTGGAKSNYRVFANAEEWQWTGR